MDKPENVGVKLSLAIGADYERILRDTHTSEKELYGMIAHVKTYDIDKLNMLIDYLKLNIGRMDSRAWFDSSIEQLPTRKRKHSHGLNKAHSRVVRFGQKVMKF